MTHEIIEVDLMGEITKYVLITREDGSKETFAVDDNNPRYQQWLEAGNEPEVIEEA